MRFLAQKIEIVPVDSIKPFPGNPRRSDTGMIRASLDENGMFAPVIVQRSSGHILHGNHTWESVKDLGSKDIAVAFVDVDDAAARKIVAAANRTSDLSTYDDQALYDLLAQISEGDGGLAGTGYEQGDLMHLEQLLAPAMDLDDAIGAAGDDAVPQESDLWPELKFRVPPHARDGFLQLTTDADDDTDTARFLDLLRKAGWDETAGV
ncbi:ParB N-terminal domain-containing protein [Kitasatospora sp. NPDC056076]|uniref:ParB N-terminal domain-containing protein n=1 Tax=Kitasatospora sp. NPDC056076 TaxID=3345703 RepID=UPI0035DD8667